MREIKFKGKRLDNGKWVYGDLVHKASDGSSNIIEIGIRQEGCYPVEVIPKTVGQYTELKDKKDVEIYEGDIVKDVHGDVGTITYIDGCYSVECIDATTTMLYYFQDVIEVISNIHENPELMEVSS